MKRHEKEFPLENVGFAEELCKAWKEGWLDEFSDEHFLIKALENRLDGYPGIYTIQSEALMEYPMNKENFQINFCINFSNKIGRLISIFGEKNVERFFTDQLSAGKDNYDENQFLGHCLRLAFWVLLV